MAMAIGATDETAAARDHRADRSRRWERWPRRLAWLASVTASLLILLHALSIAGIVDWARLETVLGQPWDEVLNPAVGPSMAMLLAAEGLLFLLVLGAGRLVAWPRLRAIGGDVVVVLFHRVSAVIWLPVIVAAYLLTTLDGDRLRTEFRLPDGEPILLTLPTLLGILLFGLAALFTRPRSAERCLPRPLDLLAGALPVVVAGGLCVALDRQISEDTRAWNEGLGPRIIAQIAIAAAELAFVLLVAEASWAAWRDFRSALLRGRRWSILATFRASAWLLVLGLPVAGVVVGIWIALAHDPPTASVVLDRDEQVLQVFYRNGGEYRLPAGYDAVSPLVYQAIESVEDRGLLTSPHTHAPINPVRAADILNDAAGPLVGRGELSGGSGLGAQTCKSVSRQPVSGVVTSGLQRLKLNDTPVLGALVQKGARAVEKLEFEFACGWALEQTALWHPSPDRDLVLLYLNEVEWGHQAHGVRAAARLYFDKRASELTVPEAALLAGLLRAPGTYDPWAEPENARERRGQVLTAMVQQGHLSELEAAAYDAEPLGVLDEPLHPPRRAERFVIDPTMAELERRDLRGFSTKNSTVTTTLDLDLQQQLVPTVRDTIAAAEAGGVNNAGVVVLDPRSGEIYAWYGGAGPVAGERALPDMVSDYLHQPGSTIKPFVYACALEYGVLGPDEWLDDTQRIVDGHYIANWDLESWGETPAADLLVGSRNVPAAELVERMSPEAFARCMHDVFGVRTDLHPERHGAQLGLGLAEMSLLELARAYAILANGGIDAQPTAVLAVYDGDGGVRYTVSPTRERRVLSCASARWVRTALFDVSAALGLPDGVASKTGTTSSTRAIAGYAPGYVVVGWIGRAEPGKGLMAIDDEAPGAAPMLQHLAWNALPGTMPTNTSDCDDDGWTSPLPRREARGATSTWSMQALAGVAVPRARPVTPHRQRMADWLILACRRGGAPCRTERGPSTAGP